MRKDLFGSQFQTVIPWIMIALGPDVKQDILVELPVEENTPLSVSHGGGCGQRQTEGGDAGTPVSPLGMYSH